MSATFEGRMSESPYIEMVWRGRVEQDYFPVCPADVCWNLLFVSYQNTLQVSVEGPTTKSVLKSQFEGSEFLVIKFKLGTFMPFLTPNALVDTDTKLPETAGKSFWLNSATWSLPDYDNAETFVNRLIHDGTLIHDPVVISALQDRPQAMSSRTVRRRFLLTTGLTQGTIRQIERAQQAAALLEQGASILDTAFQTGYADQPHLTRSLKRYFGQTPAQMMRAYQSE